MKTERAHKRISEGVHLVASGSVVLRGTNRSASGFLGIRDVESTGSLVIRAWAWA